MDRAGLWEKGDYFYKSLIQLAIRLALGALAHRRDDGRKRPRFARELRRFAEARDRHIRSAGMRLALAPPRPSFGPRLQGCQKSWVKFSRERERQKGPPGRVFHFRRDAELVHKQVELRRY